MTITISFIAKSKDVFSLETWEDFYKLIIDKHRRYDEFSDKLEKFLIENFESIKNNIQVLCDEKENVENCFPKVRVAVSMNKFSIRLSALTAENKEQLFHS